MTDLHRYAKAAEVLREIASAAPSPQDEQACETAAAACDQMAELQVARQVVAAARALDDERLDPTDVAERLADALAAYDQMVTAGSQPPPAGRHTSKARL